MIGGVSIQQRLNQLRKMKQNVPEIIKDAMEVATNAAIEAAAAATPPKDGTGRGPSIGVNIMGGTLKEHWATDSKRTPERRGNEFISELNNNKDYASFVNDGHRMDRHFVPGLYVDPETGTLNYDPAMDVGLIVGTKTKYVKGEFMVDKGKKAFEDTIVSELDKRIAEAMK